MVQRPNGSLVLVDFGAVKDTVSGTLGGATVAGTFGFMAPEQFMGDAVPASDIYALGALAVALLSRRDPAALHDHGRRFRCREAVTASDVGVRLLSEMLAPEPGDRPSAGDVIRAVDAMGERRTGRASRKGTASQKREPTPATEPPAPVEPLDVAPSGGSRPDRRASEGAQLDRLAAKGVSLRERRQARERDAKAAEDASKALAGAKRADKCLREGLLPPWVAWIPNHQNTLLVTALTGLTLGSVFAGVVVVALVAGGLAAIGVPEGVASAVLFLVLAAAVVPMMLFWMTVLDLGLTALCRVASARELRRLTRLPLSLHLDAYLDGLSARHHRARVELIVTMGTSPTEAMAQRVRDAMTGAGLPGTATVRGDTLVLLGPPTDVVSFHGKRLEGVISHNAHLHAWTRRALDRILVLGRHELQIRDVTPEIVKA